MEYRYYNGKKDSNFNTLPGNYQRAIETEVNIELEARKLSKSYSKQFENPINQEKFFNNTCEKLANSNEKDLKILMLKESRILYLYPDTNKRLEYYDTLAKEKAHDLDTSFIYLNSLQKQR